MQDKKFLYYKNRLQSLLSRSDVLTILNEGSAKKTQESIKKPEELLIKSKSQRRPVTASFNQTLPVQKKDAEDVLNVHLHVSSNASSKSKESLRDQEGDNLEKRLQARKRASSLKPVSSREPEIPKASKIEMYQNEIEQIMEKFAEDKITRTQAIKKKYKE